MCKKLLVFLVITVFASQILSAQLGVTVQKKSAVEKSEKTPVKKKPAAKKPKVVDYYQMLKSKKSSERRTAVDTIGRKRNKKDVPVLIKALDDSDSGVKIAACDALGLMREQTAADKIISLLNDKEPQVRQSACVALGYIGNPKAQPGLIERVKKDSSNSVRTQAILILGNMRAQSAVTSLIPLLKDKNPDLRLMSAQALGKIGDSKAAPAIKNCLTKAISEMKKEKNAYRLSQYKRLIVETAKASGKLKDKSAESELKGLLKNDDKKIKLAGARALGQIGNKSGLSVAEELSNDKNNMIRTQAVETLGIIGDKSAIPVLEKIYKTDANGNIRNAARTSLYRLGWKPPKPKAKPKKSGKKRTK